MQMGTLEIGDWISEISFEHLTLVSNPCYLILGP